MPRGGEKKKREGVRPEEETPGYRRRKEELAEVEDAGGSLNTATARLVQERRRALERQEEHIIRLRRKRRPGNP